MIMKKMLAFIVMAVLAVPVFALPWEKKVEEVEPVEVKAPKAESDWHFGVGAGVDTSFDFDGDHFGVDVFGTVRKDSVFGIVGVGYTPIKKIDDFDKDQMHGFAGVGYEF